ncbi:MAG: pyridoxal phosphate-dependent aminotransferase, partial [Oscillospiraceae bacterium]
MERDRAILSEDMVALGTQRSVIRELFEFGKRRAAEQGAGSVFDFSLGNPSVPPPEAVTRRALDLLEHQDPLTLHGYTSAQGDLSARCALADDLNRRFDAQVSPQRLYLTCGAAAALCCCFRALFSAGDRCVVFAPYFPEYKVFIEGAGGVMVTVPPALPDFQIDFSALEGALTPDTKAVVVNSPNNPSGAVYDRETLQALAALLTRRSDEFGHPIYLISDEPYRELVYEGTEVPWIPALYPNTLVCYSFSKSLSLPGERIGYALVPPAVTDGERVYAALCGAGRSMGYVNAPSLFQRVAADCCGVPPDLSRYDANRLLLLNGLREIGYECTAPQGAFYLFP